MIYEFEVPGKVIGKGRPRLNSYTGIVYTPTRTKDYESLVEQYFLIFLNINTKKTTQITNPTTPNCAKTVAHI